jgi:predicted RNA-binding protein with PUA-like domain
MNYFLAKSEPSSFSIQDLARDQITTWDGVHNHQAIAVIKSWQIGDLVLIYHSVKEARIVGLGKVISQPEKDLDDIRGFSWHAKIEFVREFSEECKIGLKEIKSSGLFTDFALVRQSRLSTMACPKDFITWLEAKGLDLGY